MMSITSSFGGCSRSCLGLQDKSARFSGAFPFVELFMGQEIEEQAYRDARRVLRTLMMGVDPENHSRLSPECVVMQPEVKVALALGVEALRETEWVRRWREKRAGMGRSVPATRDSGMSGPQLSKEARTQGYAGQPWSKQEDGRLCSAFHQGRSSREIAAAHGRTSGAIEARLVRLGLIATRREARSTSR